jgi:hypothetical protein
MTIHADSKKFRQELTTKTQQQAEETYTRIAAEI